LSDGATTFYFGLDCLIGCSSEGAVFFLFFLFLPLGFCVDYKNFITAVGREIDWVAGSTNNWAMSLLSCFTINPKVAPIIHQRVRRVAE